MKEIKFLKDLPIKLTNANKNVISVVGGDIYYDTDGNRFGYITFKNLLRSPIFAIQLFIREYDIDGKFVRDNEFFEAYTYYPSGNFVINQPVILDKETEAIEVNVVKLTLKNRNFIEDKFVGFKEVDYADLFQRKAPFKKPGTGTVFNYQSTVSNPTPSVAPAGEEVEGGEENPDGTVTPAAPVQQPIGEIKQYSKPHKAFWPLLAFVAGAIAFAVIAFVIMNSVSGGVTAFNEYINS